MTTTILITHIPVAWLRNKQPGIDILGNPSYDVSQVVLALQRHQAFLAQQFARAKKIEDRLIIMQEIREAYEETVWATGVSRGTIPSHWH